MKTSAITVGVSPLDLHKMPSQHLGSKVLIISGLLMIAILSGCRPKTSGPLVQDIYVWQRVWSSEVVTAVEEVVNKSGGRIREVVPLAAEVSLSAGHRAVIFPEIDYASLKSVPSCGLALRIGAFPGPFKEGDETCLYLQNLACKVVTDARKAGCSVSELQIDFDCAANKLQGYRCWVAAIRKALQTHAEFVPVSITVLPSWMNNADFGPLVHEAGSFVLQVHSVELPKPGEAPALCDSIRARDWVERAGSYGVPYRVALPTYTSVVAIGPTGKVVGISNEETHPAWPADTHTFMARANAPELAKLVLQWTHQRPAAMTGLIWYRLPVSTDRMNWRWPTLVSVMAGKTPRGSLRVEFSQENPYDISLVNDGASDELLPRSISVNWEEAALISDDALDGFTLENGPHSVTFKATANNVFLSPGESRVIGWIRLSSPTKIHVSEN